VQFHLNGFRSGDPVLQEPLRDLTERSKDQIDVLIVGCGPAGLTLAAQLSAFPDINTRIVDEKSGPLKIGQADGIACRTMEMFEAFGFSERVLKEAYWVNETTFWAPCEADATRIVRTGRMQDVEDDLSEMPHLILNQARVHDFYLDLMRNAAGRLEPDYNRKFIGLSVDDRAEYPVEVLLDHKGDNEVVRAKYLVGCDGARSSVRHAIGRELVGEAANKIWGVMDVLVDTDFPDIRFKTIVRSAHEGNILIIPREGGYLVRLYVEMDTLAEGERVGQRKITSDDLINAAQRILRPYHFDVKQIAWWSVYEIGQRICAQFDNGNEETAPTVFIAGDACHTHSPKAGQGMNVSMGDTFNLGWKLAAVLQGRARSELLRTYSAERLKIAQDLIDFDRHWAKQFSERVDGAGRGLNPEAFQDYFSEHGRYTAGVSVQYRPSIVCGSTETQSLASGFPVGMRFHSAPVVRLWDAKPMQVGHCMKADGRWRLVLFSDASDPSDQDSRLWHLCTRLEEETVSPLRRYSRAGDDVDSLIDVRAVFQQGHRDIAAERTHRLLTPQKGRFGLQDREKMFCADPTADIFDLRAVSREQGCLIVVRPDQYVAHVLALDAFDKVAGFFENVLNPAMRSTS